MWTLIRQHGSSDDIGSRVLSLQTRRHTVLLVELIDCPNFIVIWVTYLPPAIHSVVHKVEMRTPPQVRLENAQGMRVIVLKQLKYNIHVLDRVHILF